MVKKFTLIACAILGLANLQGGQELGATNAQPSKPEADKNEEEYRLVQQRILERIEKLKEKFPSLKGMTNAARYEYNVQWVLDDPTQPPSKLNGRREVFGNGGYWFSLTFYRGKWGGAAVFRPIEFGNLKLWFQYGHGGNTEVIATVTGILKEENEAYCRKHPEQKPNEALQRWGKGPATLKWEEEERKAGPRAPIL